MTTNHRYLFFALTFVLYGQSSAQSTTEIAENVGRSVVMILAYDAAGYAVGQGSGVFVTDNGQILTNAHVLEGAYSAEVISTIGQFERVQILYKDERFDLALIRVSTDQSVPSGFATDTDFKAGQRVIAIGNPLGLEKTVSDGLISGIRRTGDGVELIQTTVPISPGSSGGVLLDEYGLIIGVTTSTFQGGQNINFAISLNTILQFVADYKGAAQNFKPEYLQPAKESRWYSIVGHWVANILALLLALIFGDSFYYVIPLVMVTGYIVYGIGKGAWSLVSYPFRRIKRDSQAHRAFLSPQTSQDRPSQPSQADLEESAPDETQSKQILIIGAEIGESLAHVLSSQGYKTRFLEAYAEPLPQAEIFSELSSGVYSMVIVSYWTSFDLLLEIRQRFPKLKTVFLNSYKHHWNEIARQKGVDIVLRVPFEQGELLYKIQETLTTDGGSLGR